MKSFKCFRIISYIEGLSYLILVFVAMPLKYLAGYASIVKSLGMLHGILFILFAIALVRFIQTQKEKKELGVDYFIYSLSPFGYLLIENSLKEIQWNKGI